MSSLRLISLAVVFVLGLLCTGCAGGGVPAVLTETPPPPVATSTAAGSTPTSMPSLSATGTPTLAPPAASPTLTPLSPSELKYRILAQFSPIFFCDPDLYPVAHEVGDQEISQRVATLLKNAEESGTILRHLGLAGATTLTPQQKNLIYAESKKLNAINLQPAGDKYTFSLRTGEGKGQGLAISGVIDRAGNVTVTQRQSTILTCPICLAADTFIDTPQGPVHVQDLKSGMPVWTVDL